MELTQEQINKLKSQGLDDSKISALAQQNGYTLPKPQTKRALTQNEIAQLRTKGLDDNKIQTLAEQNGYSLPEEIGGVQSFVQSVAKPFLKVASSIGSIADIAKAKDSKDIEYQSKRPRDFGYFGQVSPINTDNPLDAIGTGLEIGSYAIGGGGTASTVVKGLKGKVIQGALTGLKTGAGSGGTMSFGQALQEAEVKPSDVAYKTLFGTALGAGTGLAIGSMTPLIVKSGGIVKKFTNLDQVNTELQKLNTEVFKPTPKQLEKWSVQGKDPMKTYTEIFGTDIPQVGKDNRFSREAINDAVEKVQNVYNPAAEGFNTILRNSPEVNSISKARDMAVKNLDAFDLTPSMQERAIAKIDMEFNAIKEKAIKDGVLLGDDSIPVYYTDLLKDKFWKQTKNFGTEDASIANSVNSSIGHGFKDSIENSITDINVKEYNKKLGDLIVLRDFLDTKVGALAGTGGKMTRLFGRLAGTVAGSQFGSLGSILGNLTGDKVAQVMINPAFQPYRWILNKKLKQLPQSEILKLEQEANTVIQQMAQKRQETIARFSLPEGSPKGSASNPFITPPPKDVSRVEVIPAQKTMPTTNPKTGRIQKTYLSGNQEISQPFIKSDNTLPTTKPITKVNNNAIDDSLSFNSKKTNNLKDVSGGVAGIELKKDENGKTKVTFNPEKALIGIAGMTAYKKIPSKLREDALNTMSLFKKFKSSDFINEKGKLNFEAFSTVENLFEKASKGTITKEDIKAAEEVHFMLKGNKDNKK